MNAKLDSSSQDSSILAVSIAGASVSSSTAYLPPHLRQRDYYLEAPAAVAGGTSHTAAAVGAPATVACRDKSLEEEEDSSLSDSLNCGVTKSGAKKPKGSQIDFSDSLEDSGEETDGTAVDSDTGSFYSIDSRVTTRGHESDASLLDTEYFSESTLYNSTQSLLATPRASSRSSFYSVASSDTLDGTDPQTVNHRNSLPYQADVSDQRRDSSDFSIDYTSCPDLSPLGYRRKKSQLTPPGLSPAHTSRPVGYNHLNNLSPYKSTSLKNRAGSNSSMSAVEETTSPKVGDEFETKKKKGLMSSFRKSRKTSRKLRQQKKANADGDTTSTGTGVTSDGEQDLLLDSEPSAPNSPAPVKSIVETNAVENAVEKPEETALDNNQASHERLNGTASPKESSEPDSKGSSPSVAKSNKIAEAAKKQEEKEEKKITRNKFGSSLFRKKKTEQASTAPPTTDTSADAVASETPAEVKEDEKGDGVKDDTEPAAATNDDAQPAQTIEAAAVEEPKPEPKPSSFRSYISNVQFVKNWTVSSDTPKAQQTAEAKAKTSLDPEAVDGEKASVDGTDSAPEGTTAETKVATSTNGKPSASEVTSKRKTTVTIVTKQSPKPKNSPNTVARRAKALVSPPSPITPSKTQSKVASTGNTLPPNISRRSKSPTPVLPKRLSFDVLTPFAADHTQASRNISGSQFSRSNSVAITPNRQHPPPKIITSDGNTKSLETVTVNENRLCRKGGVNEPHQPKKMSVNEPQTQPPKKIVSEPQQPKKVMNDSPQPKKISVNEPQQPKKVMNDSPQPKRISVNEPQQPKNTPVNSTPPPKKVFASEPQHPKGPPESDTPRPKKLPVDAVGKAEATPAQVPLPVSATPGMATPPSSPEGHTGRDARETPEGDRTENERNSFVESTDLTDSWAGASSDKREHLYKILVIGELGTGKTSIIKRYVHQFFSQHYRATIGVDFALKVLNWDNNTVIRLQLWDIAGQERFGNMTRVYYKEAVGAFVVFDVTRAQTFDAVTKWKTDLDTKVTLADGSPIPTVLLANKCDQPKEGVVNNPARMDDYCRERGFSGWFETSAKENINIDEASRFLVNKILSNEKQGMMMTESLDTDKFSVDGKANPVDKSGCRC